MKYNNKFKKGHHKKIILKEVFDKVGWDQQFVVNSGSILAYYQYTKAFEMMLELSSIHVTWLSAEGD